MNNDIYQINDILPLIHTSNERNVFKTFNNLKCKMNTKLLKSTKYYGTHCHICNKLGTHFKIIKENNEFTPVLFDANEKRFHSSKKNKLLTCHSCHKKQQLKYNKQNQKNITRYETLSIIQGLSIIDQILEGKKYTCEININKCIYTLSRKSNNAKKSYKCFRNSIVCQNCQIIGKFFALEKYHKCRIYFLSLYGIHNNKEILFTKDHIIPKSKNGTNDMNNIQTMCYPCNLYKMND